MTIKSPIYYFYQLLARREWRLPRGLNRFLATWEPFRHPFKSQTGINQFVHPDLLVFGGRCHLAITPYPFSINTYENPEVHVEVAPGRWEFKYGLGPAPPGQHYSDPDLWIREGRLMLLYRSCDIAADGREEIRLHDLALGTEEVVLTGPKGAFLSPAACSGEPLTLFAVDLNSDHAQVVRYRLDPQLSHPLREAVSCPIENIWHLDVQMTAGRMEGLFLSLVASERHANSVHFVTSQDGGLSFQVAAKVRFLETDAAEVYRASLVNFMGERRIAVSYRTLLGHWRTKLYTGKLKDEFMDLTEIQG